MNCRTLLSRCLIALGGIAVSSLVQTDEAQAQELQNQIFLPVVSRPYPLDNNTFLLDYFAGTGSLDAHTPLAGGPWMVAQGLFTVLDGRVVLSGADHAAAVAQCGAPDVEMSATIDLSTDTHSGLVLRSNSSATNRLLLEINIAENKMSFLQYTDLGH